MLDKKDYIKTKRLTYTYFITDGEYYKIGKTRKLKDRMAVYRTHSTTIEWLGFCLGDKERELHKKYNEYNYLNEWFDFTEDLVEEIKINHFPIDDVNGCTEETIEVFDKEKYESDLKFLERASQCSIRVGRRISENNNLSISVYNNIDIENAFSHGFINEWEVNFVTNVSKFKKLSDKQLKISRRVVNKIKKCKVYLTRS